MKKAYVYANRQIVLVTNKLICLFLPIQCVFDWLVVKIKICKQTVFSYLALFYFTNCLLFLLASINAIMKFCFLNLCIGSKTDSEGVSRS